ncbi:MAG: hypothetical protein QHH14_07055 [Clostridiales bacterium]|nr:hypothetical protein [Clostridiales bacterium]
MKKYALSRGLVFLTAVFLLILFAGAAKEIKQPGVAVRESFLDGLTWRCIGPANMGGRIDDLAVVETNPRIIYVATASGGLWKTTNNGVTWEPIFDSQTTSTIGDVTVSPSHPDIVWVGTGEPNNRQSSSWGDGVYKSEDGGRTWKNMGLRDSHHIGRIVIHPANPDVVYVAALGHLWGPNKERGLFRTTDGGKTWVNTKFIDENTGFVDVAIDFENPSTLYAAAYQRQRTAYGFSGGGPGSGLYKTTDGGETWVKLTSGLPEGPTGRIGIDVYRRNPNIVYAIIENKNGGVFRSEDKGLTWKKMSSTNPRPMYYSKIRIDPNNDQRIWVLGAAMYFSEDGGKTFRTDHVEKIHSDHHAMWINPADSGHMILGSDGGIHFSYDRGQTWDFVNTIPLGQFYEVGFDMRKPYYVYGGLQDNGSWGGPSATWTRIGITNDEWIRIGGGDGFYTQVDPTDHTTIYAESQDGNIFRFDLRSGESKSIRPQPDQEGEQYRFNWNSPILLSPHNPKKVFFGGNRLFISRDRGDTWEPTADLTTQTDRDKLPIMGVTPDAETLSRHDGVSFYGTITTVSESPLKEGVLYVGTDDGLVQVSRDDGKTWKNVTPLPPAVPKNTYVSRVEASRHAEGRAFVTFDGHRSDDFKAYAFMTDDFGGTWKNISGTLPAGGTLSVIREHHRNPDLLFVGTERGAYVSLDRGVNWTRIKSNLPLVPVDDIAIHPRENDLIFGTHGRSIWILDDITPLEQLKANVLAAGSHLFDMRPAVIFNPYSHKGDLGHKFFVASNPPYGALINYYLREKVKEEAKIVIANAEGKIVRELKGAKEAGIHRITWDLRYPPPADAGDGAMERFAASLGPFVLPGEYKVTLAAGGVEMTKTLMVDGDPRIDVSFDERKAQHDALMRLYKLTPLLGQAQRTLDTLQRQFRDAEGTLKKVPGAPAALTEALKSAVKEVEDIRKELVGDPSAGFRGMMSTVRGRLLFAGRSISGYTGAPSERQLKDIAVNEEKLVAIIERINKIIDETIPRLNKLMNENNVPHLLPVPKIKLN